jgi:hypothetical protein
MTWYAFRITTCVSFLNLDSSRNLFDEMAKSWKVACSNSDIVAQGPSLVQK